jgi:hypothetical protein
MRHNFPYFGQYFGILWKNVQFSLDTDPDWQALDTDPDPAKLSRFRVHYTVFLKFRFFKSCISIIFLSYYEHVDRNLSRCVQNPNRPSL